VDDESDVRKLVVDVLNGEGYQIVEAESAERAMELARSQTIDTFLVDIDMAGKSGIEICREIRDTEPYKFTPVILFTRNGLHDRTVAVFESGCNDVIAADLRSRSARGGIRSGGVGLQ
jgi:CheY-like chemotaxis protein